MSYSLGRHLCRLLVGPSPCTTERSVHETLGRHGAIDRGLLNLLVALHFAVRGRHSYAYVRGLANTIGLILKSFKLR